MGSDRLRAANTRAGRAPLLHSLSAGCSFASRGLATVRDPDGPVELMDPGPQRIALSRLTCPQVPERLAGLDSCDF